MAAGPGPVSGFGRMSQWFRNVEAGTAVEVRIARRRFQPGARVLEPAEAAAVVADYERRNRLLLPIIRPILSRLARFDYDGSPAARLRVVERLPLVALAPRRGPTAAR